MRRADLLHITNHVTVEILDDLLRARHTGKPLVVCQLDSLLPAVIDIGEADDVELRQVTTLVHVDLAARTLTLYDAGQVVLTTPVAVGSPEAPTPTGTFSVTDKLQTPNAGGAYGPYAFGLSGRSEVLTEFAGGDGQIGIHGTNDPASIGNNVSHGCIRVPNDVIEHLEQILPLGTPVVVS